MSYRALLIVITITFHVCTVNGSKLRSWVGPNTYFEGQLPAPRQGHGMVSTDDGVIYIFGGFGNTGKRFKFKYIMIERRPRENAVSWPSPRTFPARFQ